MGQALEQADVQVIYGVKGLKTHAKICLIVRREPHGIQRYMHFGTGNYNEATARIYSDISFMTCDDELGADATSFFNAITGYSQPRRYRKIEAAPIGLRDKLLELIEAETKRKQQGQKAQIVIKLNSLVDPQIIEALYAASQAGVTGQAEHARHLLPAPGRRGAEREHRSHQHHRSLSRTCAASSTSITAATNACSFPVPTGCRAIWTAASNCSRRSKTRRRADA